MKKILLLLAFVCTALTSWANMYDWNEPGEGQYSSHSPILVTLNVNGYQVTNENRNDIGVNISGIYAFIGDECRAVAWDVAEGSDFYLLDVVGNLSAIAGQASDAGKEITFRIEAESLVYEFSQKLSFTGETQRVTLNLNAITGVNLTNDGVFEISKKADEFPYTFDIKDYIKYEYRGVNASGETVTEPQYAASTSKLYDTMSIELVLDESSITVDGTSLTVPFLKEPVEGYLRVYMDGSDFSNDFTITISTNVTKTPVTGITINPTSITVKKATNVWQYIKDHVTVTVAPEDATNPNWNIDYGRNAEYFENNFASTPGTYTIYIYSDDDNDIKAPLTVVVKEDVSFSWSFKDYLIKGQKTEAAIVIKDIVGATDFSTSLVRAVCDAFYGTEYITLGEIKPSKTNSDGVVTEYTIDVTANVAGNNISVALWYDNTKMGDDQMIDVEGVAKLKTGWNWVALYTSLEDVINNFKVAQVEEIRSQSSLLFNDATYGFFGTLNHMTMENAMFKIKATADITIPTGSQLPTELTKDVYSGFTWMNNPYQFDVPAAALKMMVINHGDGDYIITKTGFAVYKEAVEGESEAKWVASEGFVLKEGEGFIYYNASATNKDITISNDLNPAMLERLNASRAKTLMGAKEQESTWEYDASKYPENMAIIATLPGIENAEDYSVGAFVDNEVRGEGSVVDGDIIFVNVAGKQGEKVSFKLLNKKNGEVLEVSNTLNYTSLTGSMTKPVELTVPGYTGINETTAKNAKAANEMYSITGYRVKTPSKGIYISAGKKYVKE